MKQTIVAIALTMLATGAVAKSPTARPPVEFIGKSASGTPFSSAVRVGDLLYLSGQIGIRPDRSLPDTFDGQAKQAMDNIGSVLKSAGVGWSDVIHCTVMLADMADWPAFNKIYAPYFPNGRFPARSAFGANGLALGAKLEVECQAYAGRGGAR